MRRKISEEVLNFVNALFRCGIRILHLFSYNNKAFLRLPISRAKNSCSLSSFDQTLLYKNTIVLVNTVYCLLFHR